MKRQIFGIVYVTIILLILTGCTSTKNEEIVIEAGTYEFSYIDIVTGQEMTYTKEVDASALENILNDWMSDLIKKSVNYGNNPKGNNILKDLEVKDAYFDEDTLIIVLNKPFLYFDEGLTHPVYYLNGLRRILLQVTAATEFSIEVPGYKKDIIHPDGLMIKNISL